MRLFRLILLPLLAIGLFLPALAMGGAAHAATAPSLAVSPSSVTAGGTFALSGQDFTANSTLVIKLDSATLSSTVATNGDGDFGPTSLTVPAGTTVGNHSVSAYTTGGTLLAATGLQVLAPTATILLVPTSGAPGAQIRLDGSGFTPNEAVAIAQGATTLANATANSQGQISVAVPLPQRLSPGAISLTATGSTSKISGSATYTVAAPSLTLNATSGAVGSTLTAVGHNFAAGETVHVAFNGVDVAQATVDGSGTFSTSFSVPAGASGTAAVMATGANSQITANASFTRVGGPTVLTLSPTTGAPGMHLTVSGSGFSPNESVTISTGNTALVTTTANSQGQISAGLTLPQRLSAGTISLVATGSTSKMTGSAAYVVTAPSLTLSATSGAAGSTLTAVGHNFAAGEVVRVSFNGVVVAQATADSNGTFSVPFNIPAGASGSVPVTASGVSSLITAHATFTRAGATVRANVNSLAAGATLTLTGSGFAAGEAIQISIPGRVLLDIHATAQGTFSTPLALSPSQAAGALSITATGLTSHISGATTVTVTTAPKITLSASSVAAGSAFTVTGTGFGANEAVTVSVANALAKNVTANAQGDFTAHITLGASDAARTVQVVATGQQTHRAVAAALTITRSTVIVRSNVNDITAGNVLTLTGNGFGANEAIQITIPGAVLLNIHANAQGAFSTRLTIPASHAAGALMISATGQTTRQVGVTKITVLSVPARTVSTGASTWYFAGGQTTDGISDSIAILNTNKVAVQGTMTLYYGVGQTRVIPFSLAAEARGTYDIGRLAGALPHVAVAVHANLPIAAVRMSNRGGNNRVGSAGVSSLSRTWEMAEGYTGLSFTESLFLLNPNSAPASVQVAWPLGNGRAPVLYNLTIPGRTQVMVPVNSYVKAASHATMISSNEPIAAARRIIFGTQQQGATLDPGATKSATTLYFAEGSTANGFEEYLTIFNPDRSRAAAVTAQFHDQLGHLLGTRTITVDPMSRGTIKVNTVARASSIASVLHSSLPIVAERALYFGAPNGNSAGGTVVFGRSSSATGWAFASGNTGPGSSEFDLLYNPNPQANDILITYHTASGQLVQASFNVPANARMTVDLNRSVSDLPRGVHGVTMRSLSGLPFLAEQAIYNQTLTRGFALAGAPAS